MAEPTEDIEVKVAGNAAKEFVDAYYAALNNQTTKASLPEFYIKATTDSPLKPEITLNGKVIADMEELQNTFSKRIDRCHYDPSSWDCHVINKNYNVGAAESALAPEKDGTKMSFMVMVTGSVKFWMDGHEKLDEEPNGFAESFILVPNREAYSPKAPKNMKKWLIQSQNFRRVT